MDLHLKQWKDQQHQHHKSEEQQVFAEKIPKLFLEPHDDGPLNQQHHQHPTTGSSSAALPLFVPEPTSKVSNLSAFSDSTSRLLPRMGSYFSLAQWQELELQALIYRYMLAGAAVPPELLQPIKKSLLNSSQYFLNHPLQNYSHYQPPLLQSGYWGGRGAMDPEPGRCKRTDGKKWRCSRDVVAGHKYCERHMHRGRNRSRKHVEIPTPTSSAAGTVKTTNTVISAAASSPLEQMANGTSFAFSAPSPSIDLFQYNRSYSVSKTVDNNKGLFEPQNETDDNRSDAHILRHFFDDWPRRSLQDHNNNTESNNASSTLNSATCLTISMPSSSSDVSLKLSTGGNREEEPGSSRRVGERGEPQLNWATGWSTTNTVTSMGGPLAEALRTSGSNSNSSPTSVLYQLPRSSASEVSYVST